jgi:bifunctional non-homologous end joining protein LigD
MNAVKSIRLFFQEGTSDKVYNATIVEEGGLYTVKVEWGRRATPLNQGAKAVKVSLAEAEKAFARVVREKTNKGYEELTEIVQPAAVAPPVGQGSASRAVTAGKGRAKLQQAAQLLNAVDDAGLERLLDDDYYLAQQKLDGMRLLAHVGPADVVATNRQGQVTSLDSSVRQAVRDVVDPGSVLDGELVSEKGAVYWLFDLLQLGDEDLRERGYHERYGLLQGLELAPPLRLVPTARTTAQKRELVARLRAQHAEGIVFKRDDAPYRPGRPASGGPQLKYKFIKSADVVITANAGNAYQMAAYDGDRLRAVGKVFAGTTNDSRRELDELLAAGETPVAEVRYLYATDDDLLYQPVFVQRRDDKEPADCAVAQLVRTSRLAVAAPVAAKGAPAKAARGPAPTKASKPAVSSRKAKPVASR